MEFKMLQVLFYHTKLLNVVKQKQTKKHKKAKDEEMKLI
jgi:hypothetical protein